MSTTKGVVEWEILASPVERYTRKREILRDALLLTPYCNKHVS